MSGVAWQVVARVLVARWPSGPENRGWEREQVDAIVAEMQQDVLTPYMALVGLRASTSPSVPTVVDIRELAWRAMGLTTAST